MHISVIGPNYKTLPVEIREKFIFTEYLMDLDEIIEKTKKKGEGKMKKKLLSLLTTACVASLPFLFKGSKMKENLKKRARIPSLMS